MFELILCDVMWCETKWTLAYSISYINISFFIISDKINAIYMNWSFIQQKLYIHTIQYNTIKETTNVNNDEILSAFFKFSNFCPVALPTPKREEC